MPRRLRDLPLLTGRQVISVGPTAAATRTSVTSNPLLSALSTLMVASIGSICLSAGLLRTCRKIVWANYYNGSCPLFVFSFSSKIQFLAS